VSGFASREGAALTDCAEDRGTGLPGAASMLAMTALATVSMPAPVRLAM
jgi:hypothetical protein